LNHSTNHPLLRRSIVLFLGNLKMIFDYHQIIIFWYYYLTIFIVNFTHSQYIYQSLSVLSSQGVQFLPANIPAQFISSIFVNSWRLCAVECNMNPLC